MFFPSSHRISLRSLQMDSLGAYYNIYVLMGLESACVHLSHNLTSEAKKQSISFLGNNDAIQQTLSPHPQKKTIMISIH